MKKVVRNEITGNYHAVIIERDLLGDNVYSIYNGGLSQCKLVRTGLSDRLDVDELLDAWKKRGYF